MSLWDTLCCSTRKRNRCCHCTSSALHTTSYKSTYKNRIFFWFTSDMFLKRPILFKYRLLCPFLQISLVVVAKAVPRKDFLLHLRSPAKSTFNCLTLDTPLWRGNMSTSLKNSKEHKKGTVSNQPRLPCITPTVLLGSWGRQPLEDMTSLANAFEMHAYWQGYAEEPAVKDFVARNTRTTASCKAQGTGTGSSAKSTVEILQKLS
jgi:hypothetical protein